MIKIYKITKPIRLIELFSGYGSQAMALKELCKEFDIPYQSWRTCEWEVNAIGSYKVLHCEDDQNDYSINLTKEQLVERLYKWGISSDCTSYSVAALGKHRRKNKETGELDPITDYARFCDSTNKYVISEFIKKLNPKFFFWENPRGAANNVIYAGIS